MADRSRDWLRQAEPDLEFAGEAARAGKHEWACFVAHQAAEKAVKALHLDRGQEAWGHVIRVLLEDLPSDIAVSPELLDRARFLDAFYIPTRYPNGHPEGSPGDHYGALQSREAIEHARAILALARSAMA